MAVDPETDAYLRCDYYALLEDPYAYRTGVLMPFFQRRGACTPDAEDCTQLTSMELVRMRPHFRHDIGTVKTWTYCLAKRVWQKHLRAAKSKKPYAAAHGTGIGQDHEDPRPDAHPAEVQFMRKEFLETLRKELNEIERQVFDLLLEGYTNGEIAMELQVTPQTVAEIKYRIIQKLRRFVGHGDSPWNPATPTPDDRFVLVGE